MRIFLIILISLYFASCKKQNNIVISDNTKTFSKFPKEGKVEFKKLVAFKFGNPRQMITIDSILILANYASGQKYYLYPLCIII